MRIVSGSGRRRSSTVICGSVYGAHGRPVGWLIDERCILARVVRNYIFPTNAAFHKAKRRGDKALAVSA